MSLGYVAIGVVIGFASLIFVFVRRSRIYFRYINAEEIRDIAEVFDLEAIGECVYNPINQRFGAACYHNIIDVHENIDLMWALIVNEQASVCN